MSLREFKARVERLEGPVGIDIAKGILAARSKSTLRTPISELEHIPNPSPLLRRIIEARRRCNMI